MDASQFINDYFISPIIQHEGYNIVNTVTYATIALLAVYAAYSLFRKFKILIDRTFLLNTIPFVLFGSTVRVITDSIDTGVISPVTSVHESIISSHIYDYGFMTSSPGIYIVTAALFFISLFLAHAVKNPKIAGYIGLALWVPHFMVLVYMFKYAQFAIPVLLLAAIPFSIAYAYFGRARPRIGADVLAAVVGAHALDGAATFFVIDFFGKITGKGYFEQHVIPGFIGSTFNSFFPFYLLKVGISFGAAYFIANEKEAGDQEKYFIALLLIIIGLAPGLRDLLRMATGA